MRVLGWVSAGALALTASIGVQAGRWVQAGIQCPTVGTVTGVEHPAPRANGTADRFRRVGARIVFPAGGPAVRGRGPHLLGLGPQRRRLRLSLLRLARADWGLA